MAHFTLTPAYGRDYTSKKAALADFMAGKDFRDMSFDGNGGYINRADIPKGAQVNIRYKRLTQVCVTTAPGPQ